MLYDKNQTYDAIIVTIFLFRFFFFETNRFNMSLLQVTTREAIISNLPPGGPPVGSSIPFYAYVKERVSILRKDKKKTTPRR